MKLDDYGQEQLDSRARVGRNAISLAIQGNDEETAASDVIADILTSLFGPAGTYNAEGIRFDAEAISKAEQLLDRALTSYRGDAEDYEAEPVEPYHARQFTELGRDVPAPEFTRWED